MGKPSKKTTPKVEIAAPAVPAKPLKKGKREAEEVIEKEVSKKKQKKNVKEVIKKEISKKKQKKDVEEVIVEEADEKKQMSKKPEGKTVKKNPESKTEKKKPVGKTEKKKVVKKQESSDDSFKSEEQVIVNEASEKKQKKRKAEDKTEKIKGVKKQKSSDDSSKSPEEEIVTEDSEKKQKKKNIESKNQKKKTVKKQDTRDEPSSSKSEEDQKSVAVKPVATPMEPLTPAAKVENKLCNSKDSDSPDSSDNRGDEVAAAKTGPVSVAKKKEESSEHSKSEDKDSSDSGENATASKKVPAAAAAIKNVKDTINKKDADEVAAAKTGPVSVAKKKEESCEDSKSEDKDSSHSDENATASKKVPAAAGAAIENVKDTINKKDADEVIIGKVATVAAAAKTGPVSVAKKKEESSEDFQSEDKDSSDLDENATASKKVPAAAAIENVKDTINKKDAGDSDSKKDSSLKEDTCETKKGPSTKTKNVPVEKGDGSSGDSDSEDSSSDDDPSAKKVSASVSNSASLTPNKKKEDSSVDTESGDVMQVPTKTGASKSPASATEQVKEDMDDTREDESSKESEKENPQKKKTEVKLVGTPNPVKSSVQGGKEESKSDEGSLEEASDDEPSKVQAAKKSHTASTKSSSSGDEEESSFGEEDDEKDKTPKKNVTDVEMVDVLPKTPAADKLSLSSEKKETRPSFTQSETVGSKTLYIGNLSFSVEKEDVENLFKEYGDLVDIRFGIRPDGAFKGFGHVQFATVEAAQKAFKEKNGQDLLGRPLRLDIAAEKGRSRDAGAYQKVPGIDRPTVYVRGFDKSGDEQAIKDRLRKHFSCCGEITRISLPRDDNGLKGFAYIDFTNSNDVTNALLLNKSIMKEYVIIVEAAKPRDQNGGDRGVRFSDQRGDRGGRFGDRGGRFGDRFDHRGGRFGDRGGRGRGTPNKPSMGTVGTGMI